MDDDILLFNDLQKKHEQRITIENRDLSITGILQQDRFGTSVRQSFASNKAVTAERNKKDQKRLNQVMGNIQENLPPLMGDYLPKSLDDALRAITTDTRRASAGRFARVKRAADALVAAQDNETRAQLLGPLFTEAMHYLKNRKKRSYADRKLNVEILLSEMAQFAADCDLMQYESIYQSITELKAERVVERRGENEVMPYQYVNTLLEADDAFERKYHTTDHARINAEKEADLSEQHDPDLAQVKALVGAVDSIREFTFPVYPKSYSDGEAVPIEVASEAYRDRITGAGMMVTTQYNRLIKAIDDYNKMDGKNEIVKERYNAIKIRLQEELGLLEQTLADSYDHENLGIMYEGMTWSQIFDKRRADNTVLYFRPQQMAEKRMASLIGAGNVAWEEVTAQNASTISVYRMICGIKEGAPFDPAAVMCLPESVKKDIKNLTDVHLDLMLGHLLSEEELTGVKERIADIKEKIEFYDEQAEKTFSEENPWLRRHAYAMKNSNAYKAMFYSFTMIKKCIIENNKRLKAQLDAEEKGEKKAELITEAAYTDFFDVDMEQIGDPAGLGAVMIEFLKTNAEAYLPEEDLCEITELKEVNGKEEMIPVDIPQELILADDYDTYKVEKKRLQTRVEKRIAAEKRDSDELSGMMSRATRRNKAIEKKEAKAYQAQVGKRIDDARKEREAEEERKRQEHLQMKETMDSVKSGFVKNYNEKIKDKPLVGLSDNREFLLKFIPKNFAKSTYDERRKVLPILEKTFKDIMSIDMKELNVENISDFANMDAQRFDRIYRIYWENLYVGNFVSAYLGLLKENEKEGMPLYECALTRDDLAEVELRYEVILNAMKQIDMIHRMALYVPNEEAGELMLMSEEELMLKRNELELKKKDINKPEDNDDLNKKIRLYKSVKDCRFPVNGKYKTTLQPDMEAYYKECRSKHFETEDQATAIAQKLEKNIKRIESDPDRISPAQQYRMNTVISDDVSSERYTALYLSREYVENIVHDAKLCDASVITYNCSKILGLTDMHVSRMYRFINMKMDYATQNGNCAEKAHEIETAFLALLKADISVFGKYKNVAEAAGSEDMMSMFNLAWMGMLVDKKLVADYDILRSQGVKCNFSEEQIKEVLAKAGTLNVYLQEFESYFEFYAKDKKNWKLPIDQATESFENYMKLSPEELEAKSNDVQLSEKARKSFAKMYRVKKTYGDNPWQTGGSQEDFYEAKRKKLKLTDPLNSQKLITDLDQKLKDDEASFAEKNEKVTKKLQWTEYQQSKKIRLAAKGIGGFDRNLAKTLQKEAREQMRQNLVSGKPLMENMPGTNEPPVTIRIEDDCFDTRDGKFEFEKEPVKTPLFPDGKVESYNVRQVINTCYILAPMIGMIKSGNTSFITDKLMKDVDETHVQVTLHDDTGRPVNIILQKTGRDGDDRPLWLKMLEKAVAVMTNKTGFGTKERRRNNAGAGIVQKMEWDKWDSEISKSEKIKNSIVWNDSADGNETLASTLLFGKRNMNLTTRDQDMPVYGLDEHETSYELYDYSPEAQKTIGKMAALLEDAKYGKVVVASTCRDLSEGEQRAINDELPGSSAFRMHYNPQWDSIDFRNASLHPQHVYVFHKADLEKQSFRVTDPLGGHEKEISFKDFAKYFTDVRVMDAS